MPPEGMDREAYLSAKFGNSAAAVYGRIAAAGLDSGIEFRFDSISRTPDSRMAHRMLIAAGPDNAELSGPSTAPISSKAATSAVSTS